MVDAVRLRSGGLGRRDALLRPVERSAEVLPWPRPRWRTSFEPPTIRASGCSSRI